MMPKRTLAFTLAAFLGAASTHAQGQGPPDEPSRGYSYESDDDPLDALGSDIYVGPLRAGHHPVRTYLLPPRTHWVPELNRSVQNL